MKYLSFLKILAVGLVIGFAVKWFVIETFIVPTSSMEPTILRGDIVWINKIKLTGFHTNDIIAFERNGENFIKRIVGTSVDSVYKVLGRYQVVRFNGIPSEPLIYFKIPKKGDKITLNTLNIDFYQPLIEKYEGIQAGHVMDKIYINGIETSDYTFSQDYFFVQGDNINDSIDSRTWGLISEKQILGKCFWVQK